MGVLLFKGDISKEIEIILTRPLKNLRQRKLTAEATRVVSTDIYTENLLKRSTIKRKIIKERIQVNKTT